MLFSDALRELKKGYVFRRRCWKDKEVFIMLKQDKKLMFIVIGNILVEYSPSDADLTADDWEEFQ